MPACNQIALCKPNRSTFAALSGCNFTRQHEISMLLQTQVLSSNCKQYEGQSIFPRSLHASASHRCPLRRSAKVQATAAEENTRQQPRVGAVTPHSGYHYDGSNRRFFEGWYFNVSCCRPHSSQIESNDTYRWKKNDRRMIPLNACAAPCDMHY